MERAYSLMPEETQAQQNLDMEQQAVLAQIGLLTLQMEQARARLPQVEERQRSLISQTARRLNLSGFLAARIVNGNLVCQYPDALPEDGPPQAMRVIKTNGLDHATVQE